MEAGGLGELTCFGKSFGKNERAVGLLPAAA